MIEQKCLDYLRGGSVAQNEQITAVIASNSSHRGPGVVEKAAKVKLNELNAEKIPKFR